MIDLLLLVALIAFAFWLGWEAGYSDRYWKNRGPR